MDLVLSLIDSCFELIKVGVVIGVLTWIIDGVCNVNWR